MQNFNQSRPLTTSSLNLIKSSPLVLQTFKPTKTEAGKASNKYNKNVQQEDIDSDSDSDDEYERKRQDIKKKYSQKVSLVYRTLLIY